MKTLVEIRSSLEGAEGASSRLAARFISAWRLRNPGGQVITRDLAVEPIPHLTGETFRGFRLPADQRSPEQATAAALSDRLIAELQQADEIVLAVPMYNFSVPSTLRAYFDHIARAGLTFRYTAEGPEGLLKGKRAYVFITRGGFYAPHQETQTAFLKQFLGFLGITDTQFIYAEGLGMGEATRSRSLAEATDAIAELLRAPSLAA